MPSALVSCTWSIFGLEEQRAFRRSHAFPRYFYYRAVFPDREWPFIGVAFTPVVTPPYVIRKPPPLPSLSAQPSTQTTQTFLQSCGWMVSISWTVELPATTTNTQDGSSGLAFVGGHSYLSAGQDGWEWDWECSRGGWSYFFPSAKPVRRAFDGPNSYY